MKQFIFDIVVVLAVPALIIVGYSLMHNVDTAQLLTVVQGGGGNTQDLGKRTTAALDQLNKIQLDGSIFTYSQFKTLKYSTVQIVQEPVGRGNPFNDQ